MTDELKKAEELYSAGKVKEAKFLLLSLVAQNPENVDAQNNLGFIFFQEGDMQKALKHLEKALLIDPLCEDALVNYASVMNSLGRLADVVPLLKEYLRQRPESADLREILDKLPDDQQEAPEKKIETPKKKIAFICIKGLDNFLSGIVGHARKNFEVRTCFTLDKKEMHEAILWADTVWLEWANDSTVDFTNHPDALNGKRVICRLHSYEAFSDFVAKIKWERIDDLIFVADHIRQIVGQLNPNLNKQVKNIHIIPSGVDLEKYPLKSRRKGKNIALLGGINYKKGPMLLLHAFHALYKQDPEYRLFLGGEIQDLRYPLYFTQMVSELGLRGRIVFEGGINDPVAWFEDKHYIVCTSILESQNMSIMEAMACGIKPLVHNFVGARAIYAGEYIWNTIDDFVRMALETEYDSEKYRRFIEENYSLEKQLNSIGKVLASD